MVCPKTASFVPELDGGASCVVGQGQMMPRYDPVSGPWVMSNEQKALRSALQLLLLGFNAVLEALVTL